MQIVAIVGAVFAILGAQVGATSVLAAGATPSRSQVSTGVAPGQVSGAIAAGVEHTCDLTDEGGVRCWGSLGSPRVPTMISGLESGVTAVSGGWNQGCALLDTGGLTCWNSAGVPAPVPGLSTGVAAVESGATHTCAVLGTGAAMCWGDNTVGQLGDGTTTTSATPIAVSGLESGVVAIDAGYASSCAVLVSGGVKCWGDNFEGQLGDGTTTSSLTPVEVVGLGPGMVAVAVGGNHACALGVGGDVRCWGFNGEGQLGDGTTVNRLGPVPVSGLGSGAVAITTGLGHTCALLDSGGVKCWGSDSSGQLGTGLVGGGGGLTPTAVDGLSLGVAEVSAGQEHTCVALVAGGSMCWGYNGGTGPLGDGSSLTRWSPVDVLEPPSSPDGIVAIAGDSEAEVSWNAPADDGGSAITGFVVTPYLEGVAQDAILFDASANTRMVTGLTNGAEYTFTVAATNVVGTGADSAPTGVSIPFVIVGRSLAAGWRHTCGLTESGGVQCWGFNSTGQLGDGTQTNRPLPVAVDGLSSGVESLAAGALHSCALSVAGGVKCWGGNNYGQLGDGTQQFRPTPVVVSGLESGVVALSAREFQTCAVLATGAVRCWGWNGAGGLGDGTLITRLEPVNVVGLPDASSDVVVGDFHTCVLSRSGGVRCWGQGGNGQLGDGLDTDSLSPVFVVGLESDVAELSAGRYTTCARSTAGVLSCWGLNWSGQLGDGTSVWHASTPVLVAGLGTAVVGQSVGDYHACAVLEGGDVRCWGGNTQGQLGDGSTIDRNPPVTTGGIPEGAQSIVLGSRHSCAELGSGAVRCWGANESGQLGDGTLTDRLEPVRSGSLATAPGAPMDPQATAGIGQVAVSWSAAASDGGQLVTGYVVTPYEDGVAGAPVGFGPSVTGGTIFGVDTGVVFTFTVAALNPVGQGAVSVRSGEAIPYELRPGSIAAGDAHSCAVTTTGGVRCWGSNFAGMLGNGGHAASSTPTPVVGLDSGVVSVAVGSSHSCALLATGAVRCWGWNSRGQLGDSFSTLFMFSSPTPTGVIGIGSAIGLSAGRDHTCAVLEAGAVRCWGSNASGQISTSTVEVYPLSVEVPGIGVGQDSVAAGGDHTCALSGAGGVTCWGSNAEGQLGDGSTGERSAPVAVTGLATGVEQVAAGARHSCALRGTGGLSCWGDGGLGSFPQSQSTPIEVDGLSSGVAKVSAGQDRSCAVLLSGGVQCWGLGRYHGDGSQWERYTPVDVVGMSSGVVDVAAGSSHSCAVLDAGSVRCWGYNSAGQLGDGTTQTRLEPVLVLEPPTAPTEVIAVAGDGEAEVSWIAPTDDGGSAITGFVVTPYLEGVVQDAVLFDASTTSRLVTGLDNGAEYTFTVAATNEVGAGVESALSDPVTPVDLVLTPGIGSVLEGDDGAVTVDVPITLSNPSAQTITVNYSTFDNGGDAVATTGSDYEATSGALTFAPGETSKVVSLTVFGDDIYEPPLVYGEWAFVAFSGASGARIDASLFGLGIGVIVDDDPLPTIMPGNQAVVEGDSGSTVVNVPVTLSNPSAQTITVNYATFDNGGDAVATPGLDYEATSGTLTFAPGETSKSVAVTVLGDTVAEPPLYLGEWAFVAYSGAVNATIDPSFFGLGIAIIIDDD